MGYVPYQQVSLPDFFQPSTVVGPHQGFLPGPLPCFSKCWLFVCWEKNIWKSGGSNPDNLGRSYTHGMTHETQWERFFKNQSTPVEIDPGNRRSSIIVYTKTSDDGCWMDVEFYTRSSTKTSKTSDVEWMSIRSNLYEKETHKKNWNPQSRNSCACFPFSKATPLRKNSPSQQGHIDLAMARTRSWSKKYVIQLSPNLLVVKIWDLFNFK